MKIIRIGLPADRRRPFVWFPLKKGLIFLWSSRCIVLPIVIEYKNDKLV